MFQCEKCNKEFARKDNLNRHKKSCKGPTVELVRTSFPCQKCGKVFGRKDNCERHEVICGGQELKFDKLSFPCHKCDKVFGRKDHLKRHEDSCSGPKQDSWNCSKCRQSFSRKDNMLRHTERCSGPKQKHSNLTCPKCDKRFVLKATLDRHVAEKCNPPEYKCQLCDATFNKMAKLFKHRTDVHFNEKVKDSKSSIDHKRKRPSKRPSAAEVAKRRILNDGSTIPAAPQDPEEFPDDYLPFSPDEDAHSQDMRRILHKNWQYIRTHTHQGLFEDRYVIRLDSTDPRTLRSDMWKMFYDQQSKFKINLAYGFVLRTTETGELRYWHASHGQDRLYDMPKMITNKADFESFLEDWGEQDILEWARQQRPTSKDVVDCVTNVTVYIDKLPNELIGCGVNLPDYVLDNPGIISLVKDEHNRYEYLDQLCIFRCLAVHMGADLHTGLQTATKELFHSYTGQWDTTDFPGISLEELGDVENMFEININVYELSQADDGTVTAHIVNRSMNSHETTMCLNLHKNAKNWHFSYIRDLEAYSRSFSCRSCGKVFHSPKHVNQHEKNCSDATEFKYTGGVFGPQNTVFEQLDEEGIHIPENMRFCKYFAVFDYEVTQESTDLPEDTTKVNWKGKHIPLSYSIHTNLPGYDEPIFEARSEDGCQALVDHMVDHLLEMARIQRNILYTQLETYFNQIDEFIAVANENDPPEGRHQKHPLEKLKDMLTDYIQELSVIGFNSGKYDLNVIKPYLHAGLLQKDPLSYIVKRGGNNYMALKGKELKFLDIKNYLTPDCSYDAFIKAHGCKDTKGFLPYEWLDSLDKLKDRQLPPKTAFDSELKNTTMSDEDYAYCQDVWRTENMQTMYDFLKWYNNRDVGPFVEAIEKQMTIYKNVGLDMFRDGISVPGLCMKLLFKRLDSATYFTLYGERDKDLYHTVKSNVVGGPSIIFHRYHEAGETLLRTNQENIPSKPCEGVVGYDANALYLWAMQQMMPTGWFVRRKAETNFKADTQKFKRNSRVAHQWLSYIEHAENTEIRTSFNQGEKKLGRKQVSVDGWCARTNTVYQFHGCWWHGHDCYLAKNLDEEEKLKRHEKTKATTDYLRGLGYTVVEKRECEWYRDRKRDRDIRSFIANHHPEPNRHETMTEDDILRKVKNGSLFGMVECDIEVPETLKDHFAEMTPIFKNTDISLDDIGPTMKEYAETHKIMNTPRRCLIGSYRGEKILLTTPLLRWYLEHGLVVTKIYEVIEYEKNTCFKSFGDTVSEARRLGDIDIAKAILADTWKLLGNASYGKCATDKTKHVDVKFVSAPADVSRCINDRKFKQLNEVSDDLYEITMKKGTIRFDLPVQIAFFVYNYAKLRMLEFYYDFLDHFLDRKDFEYCEMDTDSAYIALAAPSIEKLIKPHLVDQFYNERDNWLPAVYCDNHRQSFKESELAGLPWTKVHKDSGDFCQQCFDVKSHTRRTPGLFKVEWKGKGIIALCSKTYYCFGSTSKDHVSAKGVVKHQNALNPAIYKAVLESETCGKVENRGFRSVNNTVYTYVQAKDAISYFYGKRKVCDDKVSTLPLDI